MKPRAARTQNPQLYSPVQLLLVATLVAGAISVPYFATAQNRVDKGLPTTSLTEDQAILHALNRLGFGPRPGDVERVKQMGLAKWIDQQLHPESINDSKEDARIHEFFPTLSMSSKDLVEKFPQPKVAARQQGTTPQEIKREQQERLRDARQRMAAAEAQPGEMTPEREKAQKGAGPPAPQLMNYREIETPQRLVAELSMAKVDRAVYSERQLYEEMVDFWFNHFNVFAGKGQDRWLLTSYERDAIRPHAMGKFRDLLEATAKSPAMLFYLDNWQSVDPDAAKRQQELRAIRQTRRGPFSFPPFPMPQQQARKNPDRGLNENYGRELLELHTLGVDGGYTQQDVINVARAFTGWTIRTPQRDPEFFFNEQLHDPKSKMVLDQKIDAGGMRDGEKVLDLLARNPKTAHHISLKLARHFVSDNPPSALVDRMAQTFLKTDGDIRAVLRTMIDSPEF